MGELNMSENETETETKCKECGYTKFSRDSTKGELICMKCGTLIDINDVDSSPEWRAFDVEQKSKRTRTGAPITFTKHDKGFSTDIGNSSAELYKVPVKKRAQYYRLRKWNKRLTKSKDRNLSYSLSELQDLWEKYSGEFFLYCQQRLL